MNPSKPRMGLRWLTLFVVLLNVVVSSITDRLGIGGESIATVTRQYDSLFVPAGYAFSIWGLIYLSFVIYSIVQLLPSQKYKPIYEQLDGPVMWVNILGLLWQLVFRFNQVTTSLLIILVMLIAGIVLFVRSQRAVSKLNYSRWLLVPASIFLGWICVATIANVSVWLIAIGWDGGNISAGTWTMLLLSVALLLGLVISLRYKNFIYPAVIAWATFAIWIALQNRMVYVAQAALFTAIAAMVLTLIAIVRNVRHTRRSVY
jgi:hypothetical protein